MAGPITLGVKACLKEHCSFHFITFLRCVVSHRNVLHLLASNHNDASFEIVPEAPSQGPDSVDVNVVRRALNAMVGDVNRPPWRYSMRACSPRMLVILGRLVSTRFSYELAFPSSVVLCYSWWLDTQPVPLVSMDDWLEVFKERVTLGKGSKRYKIGH